MFSRSCPDIGGTCLTSQSPWRRDVRDLRSANWKSIRLVMKHDEVDPETISVQRVATCTRKNHVETFDFLFLVSFSLCWLAQLGDDVVDDVDCPIADVKLHKLWWFSFVVSIILRWVAFNRLDHDRSGAAEYILIYCFTPTLCHQLSLNVQDALFIYFLKIWNINSCCVFPSRVLILSIFFHWLIVPIFSK